MPRLGTILLSTILKKKGYNSKAFIEGISEPDWNMLKEADIIGISSITSTAPRHSRLQRDSIPWAFQLLWEVPTPHSCRKKA